MRGVLQIISAASIADLLLTKPNSMNKNPTTSLWQRVSKRALMCLLLSCACAPKDPLPPAPEVPLDTVPHYICVTDQSFGLHVVDITEPEVPRIIGSIDTLYGGQGIRADAVATIGSYAYVADIGWGLPTRPGGLRVVDISNPANPSIVGVVDPENAYAVSISGDRAFAIGHTFGGPGSLYVIDISVPSAPVQVGSVSGFGIGDVTVVGANAYAAVGLTGLKIVDISNPAMPVVVSTLDTPGEAWDVVVVGSYAYLADGVSGLQVVLVTNPRSPRIVSSVDGSSSGGGGRGIAVMGAYAYLADGSAGLQVVDISDPENPTIVGSVVTDWATDVAISIGYAFIADGPGLRVIDIADPTAPRIVGFTNTGGAASGVALVSR